MFVLGHVGIGPRLLGRLRARVPPWWLALGCVLPDLIDKPLFYGLLWLHGSVDPVVRGSRSIGHTLLLLLAVTAAARLRRSPVLWAVAAGIVTHFVLDVGGELAIPGPPESSIRFALFWPLLGWGFPVSHFETAREHLHIALESWYVVAGEIAGAMLLVLDWRRRRRQVS